MLCVMPGAKGLYGRSDRREKGGGIYITHWLITDTGSMATRKKWHINALLAQIIYGMSSRFHLNSHDASFLLPISEPEP
jgi:hypothetical protein